MKRRICERKNEAGASDLHTIIISISLGWRLGRALVVGLEACGLGSFGTRGQGCGLVAFLHLRFLLCQIGELGARGADVTFRLE
jgi:hypothetical protein